MKHEKLRNSAEWHWYHASMAMGCVVCRRLGKNPFKGFVVQHHIKNEKGERISHFATVPLCEPHHTGKYGVHRDGPKEYGYTEMELLSDAIEYVSKIALREVEIEKKASGGRAYIPAHPDRRWLSGVL